MLCSFHPSSVQRVTLLTPRLPKHKVRGCLKIWGEPALKLAWWHAVVKPLHWACKMFRLTSRKTSGLPPPEPSTHRRSLPQWSSKKVHELLLKENFSLASNRNLIHSVIHRLSSLSTMGYLFQSWPILYNGCSWISFSCHSPNNLFGNLFWRSTNRVSLRVQS